ncbi:MAG: cysteine desulfurase [Gammaproteobacteria bacterium]|nr:cysteine desulfurase [Gammaproteobacteria bacterium]
MTTSVGNINQSLTNGYDVEQVRADFPALHQSVNGKPLAYLDNGATSQKPNAVIDSLVNYYRNDNSNVHRGVHTLSQRATEGYEGTRDKVKRFLNTRDTREVIFVRGTTEGINLTAHSFVRPNLKAGDEILITEMEHHSNIVPWQMLVEEKGAVLKVVPMNDAGELEMDKFHQMLGPKTKFVSVVYVANALGTVNPVREIIEAAHAIDVPVMLDAAQAVPHMAVDVQELDCDFLTFSSHKVFGPTGMGVLYGKLERLEAMVPYQGGGDMIKAVAFDHVEYNDLPYRLEAGTPNIADTIAMGVALDYVLDLGVSAIAAHEHQLLEYATSALSNIPGVRIIGTAKDKASVLSFIIDKVHAHDVGTILDGNGVAVRAGHHCSMPVMTHFGVPATARASLALYNNEADIDALVEGINRVKEIFQR